MSDDKVTPFPKRERSDVIWVCDCGCTVHYHHSDGMVVCAECEHVAGIGGSWRAQLPATPENPQEIPDEAFKTVRLDDIATFHRRRQRDAEPGVIALVIYPDGTRACYRDGVVQDQAWARRQLAAATEFIIANMTRKETP
jgi:hypothetical protein